MLIVIASKSVSQFQSRRGCGVRYDRDGSATVYDVFGFFSVNCILLSSEGCVIGEDYVSINMAVCIVESESFVVPVIDAVLDDCDFVSVHVSVEY